jgi:hypothetical protein
VPQKAQNKLLFASLTIKKNKIKPAKNLNVVAAKGLYSLMF